MKTAKHVSFFQSARDSSKVHVSKREHTQQHEKWFEIEKQLSYQLLNQTRMAFWALQQFDNMGLNSSQRLIFLVLLVSLTVPSLCDDWQASGNMSESNMTEIYSAINNNPIISSNTDVQIDIVAQTISTQFNSYWHPAWNVVIVKQAPNHNAVLYGYAFRNHWFWMNGVAIPGDSQNVLTYVIWKDYNCQTWSTLDNIENQQNGFNQDQYDAMNGYRIGPSIVTDVWATAFNYVEHAQRQAVFSSGALSIVMTSYKSAKFRGYVCTFNLKARINSYLYSPDQATYYGAYFVFQTR